MPRSGAEPRLSHRGPLPRSSASNLVERVAWRAWHAACIALLASGCIILKGPYKIQQNSPPEEFMVNPRANIVLDTELQAVLVGFRDLDGDPLFFQWVLDGRPADAADVTTFVDADDPLLHYSSFRARRTALAEVTAVQVFVTDGEDAARVTWQVVRP